MGIISEYRDRDIYFHHTESSSPRADELKFEAHFHDRFELYYFIGGSGYMSVEGVNLPMAPGDCLLLCPGETHSMHIGADMQYERMALIFSERIFSHELAGIAALLQNRKRAALYHDSGFIRSCLELIPAAPDHRLACIGALSVILVHTERLASPVFAASDAEATGDRVAAEIIAYVNAHLSERWTLDELAAALYRDKSCLERRFRAAVGTSIGNYTMKKKLINARQHMFLSGSVMAGFSAGGFGDYSSFWRQYKRFFGVSPSADLAEYKKENG